MRHNLALDNGITTVVDGTVLTLKAHVHSLGVVLDPAATLLSTFKRDRTSRMEAALSQIINIFSRPKGNSGVFSINSSVLLH